MRNFGSAHPEGYRKALRLMRLADKFGLPVITLIDTAGAYPGVGAEERHIAEAIAVNLREMTLLEVPIIATVIGEGGSGGALGFIFGSAGGAFNLNLRLTALENSGEAKTISAPKIATVDNKEATIGQGISIPFSQVSASGVNTVFVEAKLEQSDRPHLTGYLEKWRASRHDG